MSKLIPDLTWYHFTHFNILEYPFHVFLINCATTLQNKIKIMIDSGLQSGPDIARAMASGAEFTFMGRSFMYGVGALGNEGGNHTISLIKKELLQVMEQLCCEKTSDFKNHLI
jgi:L-lactate dehydrogenase (cytochrome)